MADKGSKISWKEQNDVGGMILMDSRELYGQGQQRTGKVGGLEEGNFM